MSKQVDPSNIHTEAAPYGNTPFLLHAHNGSVRVNHVVADAADTPATFTVRGFGRGLQRRLSDELDLSLLWPSPQPDGLSLIADGNCALDPNNPDLLVFTVSGAVLHRPAPVNGPTQC